MQPLTLRMIERNQGAGKAYSDSRIDGIAAANALAGGNISGLLGQQSIQGHNRHMGSLFQCRCKGSRQFGFAKDPANCGGYLR